MVRAFQVRRASLAETRVVETPPEPGAGEVVLAVEQFALTANTVTYAVHGEVLRYWAFYPAPEGWGHVPAWGSATVVASRAPGLDEGARVYGFLTMASHVRLRPGPVGTSGVLDVSEHRAELPAVYNRYRLWGADDGDARLAAILQPLHATAWLLDDFLADQGFFGARQALLTSASSKTALAIAHAVRARPERPELVGLTSPRNVAFTRATGVYDRVIAYPDATQADPDTATLLIDMAGDRALRARVHEHWADRLVHSAAVGDTHQNLGIMAAPLAGPKPQFFFAPSWVAKRQADWGPGAVFARMDGAWRDFAEFSAGWLTIVEEHGPEAVARCWAETLAGRTPPSQGLSLSLG